MIKQGSINDDRKKITNDTWAWGERIYISRVLSNFDIPKVAIVKQITYQPHLDWLAKTMKKYGH